MAMERAKLSRADLVLVFVTADHSHQYRTMLEVIQRVTQAPHLVGCSGFGVITPDGEIEGAPGIAVMVLSSDRIAGVPFLQRGLQGREEEVGLEIGLRLRPHRDENSFMLIFPDAYHVRPVNLFRAIEKNLGSVPLIGGGPAEDGRAGQTFQVFGSEVESNAVSGVLFSGPLRFTTAITQACRPIKRPIRITAAQGNLIMELEGEPAYEVFSAVAEEVLVYPGASHEEDLRRAISRIFVGIPLNFQQPDFSSGQYVVRNILGVDPEYGIIAVGEEVQAGQVISFTQRDPSLAEEDLKATLQKLRGSLPARPQFGFYFDCCARGSSLYGIPNKDITLIKQYLGDIPIIGFLGNFEIAPVQQVNCLHAYTGVLVLVSER